MTCTQPRHCAFNNSHSITHPLPASRNKAWWFGSYSFGKTVTGRSSRVINTTCTPSS